MPACQPVREIDWYPLLLSNILKFGGSSVADNGKLELVAEKIIGLYKKNHNIVVVGLYISDFIISSMVFYHSIGTKNIRTYLASPCNIHLNPF